MTPRDEPTLRISRPSSASSRSRMSSARTVPVGSESPGLSPSSVGLSVKFGFRSAARNASAMTAASAPLNGAASLPCDSVDAPSLSGDGARAAAPAANPPAPAIGDAGSRFAIMGVDEPIEPRWDSRLLRRLRRRRVMSQVSTPPARRARNPSTTITAIAQWGNEDPLPPGCTLPAPSELVALGDSPPDPVPVPVGPPAPPWAMTDCDEAAASADDSDANDADITEATEAAEAEAAEAEEAAAADVIEATTESAKVVSSIFVRREKNAGVRQ